MLHTAVLTPSHLVLLLALMLSVLALLTVLHPDAARRRAAHRVLHSVLEAVRRRQHPARTTPTASAPDQTPGNDDPASAAGCTCTSQLHLDVW